MAIKTYYKPTRSRPRYFSPCDVARISFNCVDDTDATIQEVMLCIAKRFKFEAIALPTSERDLPDNFEKITQSITDLTNKVLKLAIDIEDIADQIDLKLTKNIEAIPKFLFSDEQEFDQGLISKIRAALNTAAKKALNTILKIFELATLIRDTARETSNELNDLVLQIQEFQKLIEAAKDILKLEILTVIDLKNCNCNSDKDIA